MKRRPLYSRSGKARSEGQSPWVAPDGISPVYAELQEEAAGPTLRQRTLSWWRGLYARHPGKATVVASALISLLMIGGFALLRPPPQDLSQARLDAAVN